MSHFRFVLIKNSLCDCASIYYKRSDDRGIMFTDILFRYILAKTFYDVHIKFSISCKFLVQTVIDENVVLFLFFKVVIFIDSFLNSFPIINNLT